MADGCNEFVVHYFLIIGIFDLHADYEGQYLPIFGNPIAPVAESQEQKSLYIRRNRRGCSNCQVNIRSLLTNTNSYIKMYTAYKFNSKIISKKVINAYHCRYKIKN